MANPFDEGYKQPENNTKYFKPQKGANLIRIVTPKDQVVTYFIQFVEGTDGKKVKISYPNPGDGNVPQGDPKGKEAPKLVWAVTVLNKDANVIQVWEISQKSIQNFLLAIGKGRVKNDWTQFDIQITRTGEMKETEYNLITDDKTPLTKEEQTLVDSTSINLKAMETGDDPYSTTGDQAPNVDLDQVGAEMPF